MPGSLIRLLRHPLLKKFIGLGSFKVSLTRIVLHNLSRIGNKMCVRYLFAWRSICMAVHSILMTFDWTE